MYPMNMLNYKENTYVSYAYNVDRYALKKGVVDKNENILPPPPHCVNIAMYCTFYVPMCGVSKIFAYIS